jgi:hypothetical protein
MMAVEYFPVVMTLLRNIMKLGEVAEVRMGYPFRSRVKHDPAGNVVVIQMKDIDEQNNLHADEATRVSLAGRLDRHILLRGDLVFRSRGASNSAALVEMDLGDAVLASPLILIRAHAVLPAYLQWFINSQKTQAKLTSLAVGTSVMMISTDILKDLEVPVPSLINQQRIAEIASLSLREHTLMARLSGQRRRLAEGVLMRYAKDIR